MKKPDTLNNVAVFCGSSEGNKPIYKDQAVKLGKTLARENIGVVYGGASIGLMAAVANSCMDAGGRAYGVIPERIANFEVAHPGLTELHIVGSMHERKALMASRSDAFIALPGGIGTNEEIFEMWTWLQLGYHEKACCFLNIDGYYDHLLAFVQNQVDRGFLKQDHMDMVIVAKDIEHLLEQLYHYNPKAVPKIIPPDTHPIDV